LEIKKTFFIFTLNLKLIVMTKKEGYIKILIENQESVNDTDLQMLNSLSTEELKQMIIEQEELEESNY